MPEFVRGNRSLTKSKHCADECFFVLFMEFLSLIHAGNRATLQKTWQRRSLGHLGLSNDSKLRWDFAPTFYLQDVRRRHSAILKFK